MNSITLTTPDDWHLHLRDGNSLSVVVPHSAQQFARAIIMPNLTPPVTTVQQATQYRQRILDAVKPGQSFEPLMTLYLTDNMTIDEIHKAAQHPNIHAIKYYPAGATTNSDAGVTSIKKIKPLLEAMQKYQLPLLVHGEVTSSDVDVFDREAVFIDKVLQPIRLDFPELKIVFEHITTHQATQYVTHGNEYLAATITPHHLLYNRNELFKGGIRPHYYCLPILKRELHRQALIDAATSDHPRFFLGTDSAPHSKSNKESACGCAGIYSAPSAIEFYASVFEQCNAMHRLEEFCSFRGADFYGLSRNTTTITLKKESWIIPEHYDFLGETIIPMGAKETLSWKLIDR